MKSPITAPTPAAYRGIRSAKHILPAEAGEEASWEAFMPDPRTAKDRDDGYSETSVNWATPADDVLAFTIKDRSSSAEGVAVVLEGKVESLGAVPGLAGMLSAERDSLEGNPYHGNFLFRGDLPNPQLRMLAAALAVGSKVFRRR